MAHISAYAMLGRPNWFNMCPPRLAGRRCVGGPAHDGGAQRLCDLAQPWAWIASSIGSQERQPEEGVGSLARYLKPRVQWRPAVPGGQ